MHLCPRVDPTVSQPLLWPAVCTLLRSPELLRRIPREAFHMRRTMTILAGVLCASFAMAQDTTTTTTTVQFRRISTVVGGSVVLGTETLGKVTEVVINDQGCIEYLIVEYGAGFVPVP